MADADKSLSIKIAVDGAAKAAQELEKVVDRIDSITGAAKDNPLLTPTVDAMRKQFPNASDEQIDAIYRQRTAQGEIEAQEKRLKDVQEARERTTRKEAEAAKQAEEAERKRVETMGVLNRAAATFIATTLAEKTLAAVGYLKQFTTEGSNAATALNAVSGAVGVIGQGLNAFIATGNPAIGILAGLGAGVKELAAAYHDMKEAQADLKNSTQKSADQLERLRQIQQRLKEDSAKMNLAHVYDMEEASIRRAISALGALEAIENARTKTAQTARQANVAAMERQGMDSTVAKGQNAAWDASDQLKEFWQRMQKLNADLEVAENSRMSLEAKFSQDQSNGMFNGRLGEGDRMDRQAEIQKSEDAVLALRNQMTALQGEFEEAKKQVMIQATGTLEDLKSDVSEKIGEKGAEAIKIIEDSGAEVTQGTKDTMADIGRRISDALNNGAEAQQIAADIDLLRRDQGITKEAADALSKLANDVRTKGVAYAELIKTTDSVVEITKTTLQAQQDLAAKVANLENQVKNGLAPPPVR